MLLRTTHSDMKMEKNDVIALLKNMIDENIIEPNFNVGSVYSSIIQVLNQIETEERSDM